MATIKFTSYVTCALLALVPTSVVAEQPLEDASFAEGMKAISEMHVLNSLGVLGELIGIYKAINKASYAATVLNGRKWRPGSDDLGWVDHHRKNRAPDPFAALDSNVRAGIKRRLRNIDYYVKLLESGTLGSADTNDAGLAIKEQVKALKRLLAQDPTIYERFVVKAVLPSGVYYESADNMKITFTCKKGYGVNCTGKYKGAGSKDGKPAEVVFKDSSSKMLLGHWYEAESKRRCKNKRRWTYYWGIAHFTFSADAKSWEGAYGYCDDAPTHNWDGEKR